LDCRKGIFHESFLLVEEIPGTQPIRDFALEQSEFLEKNPEFREKLFTEVGHLVRRFHDHHFFHVDLSIKNILISFDSQHLDRTSLYLIDFDTCYSLTYLPDALFAPFRWTDLRRLMDSVRYGLSPLAKRNVLDAYFSKEPLASKKEANFLRFYHLTHRSDDPVFQPIPHREKDRTSSCADAT
jgi:serine/threonine protein kinase